MVHLDIIVYHLGRNGQNWDGRKNIDFVIDTKIKNQIFLENLNMNEMLKGTYNFY